MELNKVQLHFIWDDGIDDEPILVTIDVDLLRADASLTGKGEAVRLELLAAIDGDENFLHSTIKNKIDVAESDGDFDFCKYVINDGVRCIIFQSWEDDQY